MFLEHWLYLPIIGIIILVLTLLNKIKRRIVNQVVFAIFLIVISLFCIRTILRNREWTDIEKFYLNELKYTDSSIRIYNNLGMYYAEQGDNDKLVYYYEKAIETGDYYPQPHHNLGTHYMSIGEISKALDEYYKALSIDPNFIYSLAKLHEFYYKNYEFSKADKVQKLIMKVERGEEVENREIQEIKKD